MAPNQITSAVIGLIVASLIVWLVRRDHLHGKYAIWWLGIAIGFAILGFATRIVDTVALKLGIAYPPILIVLIGFAFLVIKLVTMDIEHSKNQVKLSRLAQRLAILESRNGNNIEISAGKDSGITSQSDSD